MNKKKAPGQLRLHLFPKHDGLVTRLLLSGCIVTALPHSELHQLVRRAAFLSGWPIEFVLPADCGEDHWFDCWTDAISGAPADLLEVRFTLQKAKGRPHCLS